MADPLETLYDDAVFAYTSGDYTAAAKGFTAVLEQDSDHFEAQLSLGMAYYRLEDFARAIEEGEKAEIMNANEQRVHTNLSLAYMRSGTKETAEHHGLQAKLAGCPDPQLQSRQVAHMKAALPWRSLHGL